MSDDAVNRAGGTPPSGPLAGLRVLDLSRALAGPWCALNLADLGADVIKVERPRTGDESRHWGPPWLVDGDGEPTRESAYYLSTNRNKRSVAIDISKPEGQELVARLAEQADILVENFKVGDLARYGLDWRDLSPRNPRLIYCSVTGYGRDGPFADRPGYDYLFQGLGGIMSVTGERDGVPGAGPQRVGIPVVDLMTGMYATVAVLAALEHRHKTSLGQHVDVSLFDSVMALGSGLLSNYMVGGKVPTRVGNAAPNISPYGVYPCADGQMILACANQSQFESLCRSLGLPELLVDPRFASNSLRVQHAETLREILAAVLSRKTQAQWETELTAVGVPSGPICSYAQALEHPQAVHRGSRVELPHPLGGLAPSIANPIRMSATPVDYRNAPPLLGQDTRAVLATDLGIEPLQIDRLEAAGVIGCTAPPPRMASSRTACSVSTSMVSGGIANG